MSAPAAMLFQGSSLCRTATSVQSNVENKPPHTAKLPPILGASRLIACIGMIVSVPSQRQQAVPRRSVHSLKVREQNMQGLSAKCQMTAQYTY